MGEQQVLEEAQAELNKRMKALADPAALAMKATRSLLPHLDISPVFGVLLTRALSLGSLTLGSISYANSQEKTQQLGKEVAALASDMLLLEEELVTLRKAGKEKGRLECVCTATAGLESAHRALITRSHDLDSAMNFLVPHLPKILKRYQEEVSMPHIRKMLENVVYSEAQAPYSNLLYSRCLALLLETLFNTYKEDVVSLARAFNAFNADVTELRQWIRDLERCHYLKQGISL